MANRIQLKGGIIEMIEEGDQTEDSIKALSAEALKLADGMDRVLILADLTNVGKTTSGARLAAKKVADEFPFHKMAFIGVPRFLATVIKFINSTAPKPKLIDFF